jgi:hypothetical protein
VVAFARAAQRVGYAHPADVDKQLSCGSAGFFRKDYELVTDKSYDNSPEAAHWAATVRQEYRRYPALHAELEGRLGSS